MSTNTLELNSSQITLPEGFDASLLIIGSNFPIGSIYKSKNNNSYIIPNNAVYLGTNTTYNGTDAIYTITTNNEQNYVPASDVTSAQYANVKVYIGISSNVTQYVTKLVINDTLEHVDVTFNLSTSGRLYNHTNSNINVDSNESTIITPIGMPTKVYPSKVKANNSEQFSNCPNATVSLPPNTELYCTNVNATVANLGTYIADETTDVTHLSNQTDGVSDDINSEATTITVYNVNSFNISPLLLASSSGNLLNKSNTPLQINDNGVTYVLDELCEAHYSAVATVLMYPGNKMYSDGVKVTVETIDANLIPTESNNSSYEPDSSAKDNTKEAAKETKKLVSDSKDSDSKEIGDEVAEDVGDDIIEDMAEEMVGDLAIDCVVDLIFLIFI